MTVARPPQPSGDNFKNWGARLNDYLVRTRSQLVQYAADSSAVDDGMLVWDADNSRVLYSSGGAWIPIAGTGGNPASLFYNGSAKITATADGVTAFGDITLSGFPESDYELKGDIDGAVRFHAVTTEALSKGDVVYIVQHASSGSETKIAKALASDAAKMPAFGLALDNAAIDAAVQIVTFGNLYGSGGASNALDTSAYNSGTPLYVSATTAGEWTGTIPAGESNLIQNIGKVVRKQQTNGVIKVGGAGRTNATPNLNDGNIFIGNSSNQAITASLATQVSALETSHNDVLVDGDFTSNGFMKRTGAGTYAIDSNSYLTSFTEANDLSTTVTWANVPDANITQSSVTQHQTALSITESQISDFGTYLTTHQDISGKADLSGADFTGDVSVDGDITVTGTVDGVDVSDLKYHKEDYLMIRDGGQKPLTTSFICVGNYCYIHDMATPMATMRFLDVNLKISWGYTSSTNDLQVKFSLYVPTGSSSNGESLGSATQVNGGEYSTVSVYEQWYYVAGNKTHLFTEFGAVHENQTGGIYEKKIYSWQYEPDQNRTYFLLTTFPSAPASGTTLYWHPYAWESSGTALIEYRDIDERYFSGTQNAALMFKTAYDSRQLKYKMEIREIGSGDSGQIMQSFVKISKQEP